MENKTPLHNSTFVIGVISFPNSTDISPQRIVRFCKPCPQRDTTKQVFTIKIRKPFHDDMAFVFYIIITDALAVEKSSAFFHPYYPQTCHFDGGEISASSSAIKLKKKYFVE